MKKKKCQLCKNTEIFQLLTTGHKFSASMLLLVQTLGDHSGIRLANLVGRAFEHMAEGCSYPSHMRLTYLKWENLDRVMNII